MVEHKSPVITLPFIHNLYIKAIVVNHTTSIVEMTDNVMYNE